MKPFIRVFALGLLTATILLSITYFLEKDKEIEKETVTEELSTEEMIAKLENQGYFVMNEDPSSIQEEDDTIDTENEPEKETENEIEETTDIANYNLTIESGMTISEVANYLVAASIIDSEESFIAYVTDNDYGTSIQIGQFELNSDMSIEEIANTITNRN